MSLLLHLHQSHHPLGDLRGRFQHIKKVLEEGQPGLHVFPEMHLTGYPLKDLCLHRSFITEYQEIFEEFKNSIATYFLNPKQLILCGGLKYELNSKGLPQTLQNVIYRIQSGRVPEPIYSKVSLANHDIFDEFKYFTPGEKGAVIDFEGKLLGLTICQDMWPNFFLKPEGGISKLKSKLKNQKLDLIVNLSSSPFGLNKKQERLKLAQSISYQFDVPFAYVNSVGGEDEILLDGNSFIVNGHQILAEGKAFEADLITYELKEERSSKINGSAQSAKTISSPWDILLRPGLDQSQIPYKLKNLSEEQCKQLLHALVFGLQEYIKKSKFKKVLIGLSGGIDSAVVLALAKLALTSKQHLETMYMPSSYSTELSQKLAQKMCKTLQVPLYEASISDLHALISKLFEDKFSEKLKGLADENIQSRLRGTLLYTRSNQTQALVINTSNKSEIAVGYSTQYGDSVGALSPLGDIYKSEVYQLANYINSQYGVMIPEEILERPPSAELRHQQKDSDHLPPYTTLDALLEALLSYKYSDSKELETAGFKKEDIYRVQKLYRNSEYKRRQFCPILKVKTKSFGFGYRMPLTVFSED